MLAACVSLSAQDLWDAAKVAESRAAFRNGDEFVCSVMKGIIDHADKALTTKNISVMDKKRPSISGDYHDYYSQARYYWADPTKPDGKPYISRDGESNPEIYELDRYLLSGMAYNVECCALAWYFTGDKKYGRKAASQLRTWFLDEETYMRPHLKYSQVHPGSDGDLGHAAGMIDAYSFIDMLEAVKLMEKGNFLKKKEMKALRKWFGDLEAWIMSSEPGQQEYRAKNNHSVALDVQLVAYRSFSGNKEGAMEIIRDFHPKRIFTQVQPDGSQPQELRRTIAMHYSNENIEHMIDISYFAKSVGLDIFSLESEDGRSITKAIDFLLPYSTGTVEGWPWKEINGWDNSIEHYSRTLYRAAKFNPSRADWIETSAKIRVPGDKSMMYLVF